MKTNALKIVRQYRAEWHFGRAKAGRIHVSTSNRGVVRECRNAIAKQHRNNRRYRLARAAYYLGAIADLRAHRRLCREFRL